VLTVPQRLISVSINPAEQNKTVAKMHINEVGSVETFCPADSLPVCACLPISLNSSHFVENLFNQLVGLLHSFAIIQSSSRDLL
jgi:hypothetical protein